MDSVEFKLGHVGKVARNWNQRIESGGKSGFLQERLIGSNRKLGRRVEPPRDNKYWVHRRVGSLFIQSRTNGTQINYVRLRCVRKNNSNCSVLMLRGLQPSLLIGRRFENAGFSWGRDLQKILIGPPASYLPNLPLLPALVPFLIDHPPFILESYRNFGLRDP